MKKILFLLILMIYLTIDVKATCKNQLRSQAANVSVNYVLGEVAITEDGVEHPEVDLEELRKTIAEGAKIDPNLRVSDYLIADIVNLKIYNLTDKLYVTVEEQDEGMIGTFTYDDVVDGEITIRVPDTEKIREYKVRVFSNDDSCKDEEITSPPAIKTPMYNPYSAYEICADQNANKYYCQDYVVTDVNIDEDELFKNWNNGNGQNENNLSDQTKRTFKFLLLYVLPVTLIILVIFVGIKIKRKKNKNKVNNL